MKLHTNVMFVMKNVKLALEGLFYSALPAKLVITSIILNNNLVTTTAPLVLKIVIIVIHITVAFADSVTH